MSDLAATNCGGCGCNEGGCNSILWIIILLSCCCGNNGGFCGNNGCGGGNDCLWIMKPCASFADFIEPVNAALEYHRLKKQAESDLEQANMNLFFSEKDFERIEERQKENVML